MSTLPKYVVLKSQYTGKYLLYVDEEGPLQGYLQFSGENYVSRFAKFEVEPAESDQNLVSLRSCWNNKYWVKSTPTNNWIHCIADKPEEDTSKESCTLFEPFIADDDHGFRLKHAYLGCYALLFYNTYILQNTCINAFKETPDPDLLDVFTVIDWESLVIFRQYVVFKGDNGKYLSATQEGDKYLQFQETENNGSVAAHEVFINTDESIRFKSIHLGTFWRRGQDDYILADSDDTSNNDKDTLFLAVKIEGNLIALKNLGNNKFCQNLTTDAKTYSLSAVASSVIPESQLEFSDPNLT